MPIYNFVCTCGHREPEKILPKHQIINCAKCGKKMKQVYHGQNFKFKINFKPGYDIELGEHFDSKKQRDKYMREERFTFA